MEAPSGLGTWLHSAPDRTAEGCGGPCRTDHKGEARFLAAFPTDPDRPAAAPVSVPNGPKSREAKLLAPCDTRKNPESQLDTGFRDAAQIDPRPPREDGPSTPFRDGQEPRILPGATGFLPSPFRAETGALIARKPDLQLIAPGVPAAHHSRTGPILWVQDRATIRETGIPCLAGSGLALLRIEMSRAADVLAAMEDGLACPALGGVVGEIWGDPAALDFTATRRLATRAEAAGMPCWLIRRAATANPSAARQRWRVSSLPSAGHRDDPSAPGEPRWLAQLFRSRSTAPGEWVVDHDRTSNRLHFSALPADREMAPPAGAFGKRPVR